MNEEQTRRKEKGSCGFWTSPETRRLASQPGHLGGRSGQRLRELYCDESGNQEIDLASDFMKACFFGNIKFVKKAVESGTAPDLTGCETDLRLGYLAFTVLGAQRLEVLNGGSMRHGEVLEYLCSMGCPVDQQDLAGYSALFHSVMNFPRLDLAEILVRHGANVNHQNKFGAVALQECLQQNHWKSMDFLLEHGAELNIKDADGISPAMMYVSAGPQITAVVRKWIRKRSGEAEGPLENRACKVCGKSPNEAKLSFCAKCRLVKYCSRECQKNDWKAHKPMCKSTNTEDTITLKPTYDTKLDQLVSPAEMTRQALGMPRNTRSADPRPQRQPAPVENTSNMTIKAQLPLSPRIPGIPASGSILVYNRKRTFICNILPDHNGTAYERLTDVIRQKGVPLTPGGRGVKAYLQAELQDRDQLIVRVGEVLAEQPF
ncbi:ankyrin [Rickenella mellea]|uniref:Ankyrin n=1 Tax=Rickenella mellea TaxID=50990 RepID=A0A4Y7QBD7_9AGAM|nr:ankyrin [Rickenella mellea]